MAEVVEKSNTVPVLVDFWAPWCGPCKTLTPLLEEIAQEYGDALQLVKINIDENQELAGQFGIRSVPTVYLVKHGEVIDGFMGAQPKSAIEQFLSKHVTAAAEPQSDDPVDLLLNHGNVAEAIRILESENTDESNIRLAGLYLHQNDLDNARETLAKAKESKNKPEYKAVAAQLEFIDVVSSAPSESELENRVAENPEDWDARYQLAVLNLVHGHAETALDALLEIVRQNRSFGDDAGRKGMIKAFDMLGPDSELIPKYRNLLARMLN